MTPRNESERQTHYVYRLYAGHDLYYIGCTGNPEQRLKAHQSKPWWDEITSYELLGPLPRLDAYLLEAALTENERPRFSMSNRDAGRLGAAALKDRRTALALPA